MTTRNDTFCRFADLDAAVESCRAALADYEAGLLSDTELRHELFGAGLVRRSDEVWLLDLERGAWQRYDGVSLTEPMSRLDSSRVDRWREVLDRLRSEGSGGTEQRRVR